MIAKGTPNSIVSGTGKAGRRPKEPTDPSHLAAWQGQKMLGGSWLSPVSATNSLCDLVCKVFPRALSHMRLSISEWLADVLLLIIEMMT